MSRINDLESRLDERIGALESRLDGSIKALESRFDGLERQFGELRERMAHLEGLLEGLREAITVRAKRQLGCRCPDSEQVEKLSN